MNALDKKIQSSIRLLRALDGLEPELAYSGGKDSDVILALAQMSGIKFHPIYKMTTIDPPGTLPHVISKGVEIHKPELSFFEVVSKHGMPNSNYRVCCSYLKEYKILDKAILGIRKDESTKRKKRYKEFSQCRVYKNKDRVEQFFPILNWSDDDIGTFVNHFGIQCAPLYYDEDGNFDVTRRLGCMCCPLRADKGLAHFKRYPKFVKLWIRGGCQFIDNHKDSKTSKKYGNAYNRFFATVFCNSYQDYIYKTTGLFGNLNTKQWLEDYFKIDLTV